MNNRELPDWITEFMHFTEWGEAPPKFYFWVGVATIAAALRRRVWLDEGTFVWYPNLYTLLVAPPGVVQKTTTMDLGMTHLLRNVPGIHFGPSTMTWQSMYDSFSEVGEEFTVGEQTYQQFPLVVASGEFGITLNPRDTEMIDQLVNMWDGRSLTKRTRKDGELTIPAPCLNMIACTTPDWIAGNVPRYLIGGGLTSRILFVYGDKKSKFIAYPHKHIPKDFNQRKAVLIRDLERISLMAGPFKLTPEAEEWGEAWYEDFHQNQAPKLDSSLLGGYIARKQTLTHKIAMCLSASRGDSRIIDRETLERSQKLITELEAEMPMVYSQIGMTAEASAGEQVLAFLSRYGGKAPYTLLYRYMHKGFPNPEDFNKVLLGLIQAGYIAIDKASNTVVRLDKLSGKPENPTP